MFYIDYLLEQDSSCCYQLILNDKVIGRAPIKEDFSINTSYTWKDQDNRSVVDLIRDAMRQTFKNARQLQGHMQSVVAYATGDQKMRASAYANIATGKNPIDTTYLTTPTLAHTASTYNLPTMTFIFINKEDTTKHILDAENFLWHVSGALRKQDKKNIYEGYASQVQGPKPGYKFQKNGNSKEETSSQGFKLKKGNLEVINISLQSLNVEFSRELNLDGFPQAIKITLGYKDTKRRYPADAIELVRMSGNQESYYARQNTQKTKTTKKKTKASPAKKAAPDAEETRAINTMSDQQFSDYMINEQSRI